MKSISLIAVKLVMGHATAVLPGAPASDDVPRIIIDTRNQENLANRILEGPDATATNGSFEKRWPLPRSLKQGERIQIAVIANKFRYSVGIDGVATYRFMDEPAIFGKIFEGIGPAKTKATSEAADPSNRALKPSTDEILILYRALADLVTLADELPASVREIDKQNDAQKIAGPLVDKRREGIIQRLSSLNLGLTANESVNATGTKVYEALISREGTPAANALRDKARTNSKSIKYALSLVDRYLAEIRSGDFLVTVADHEIEGDEFEVTVNLREHPRPPQANLVDDETETKQKVANPAAERDKALPSPPVGAAAEPQKQPKEANSSEDTTNAQNGGGGGNGTGSKKAEQEEPPTSQDPGTRPPIVKKFPVDIGLGGLKIDYSLGFISSELSDRHYVGVPVDGSEDSFTIARGASDDRSVFPAAFANIQLYRSGSFATGPALGLGLQGDEPRFMYGITLMYGRGDQRFSILWGRVFGEVKRLNGFSIGDEIGSASVSTESVWRSAPAFAFSYNIKLP